jgi:flagellar protein FliL
MAKDAKPAAFLKAGGVSPSSKGFMVALLVLTAVATAGGYGVGSQILSTPPPEFSPAAKGGHVSCEDGRSAATASAEAESAPASGELITLPPIIANLGQPSETFIRIEGSILVESGYSDAKILAAYVSEDIVALLKTLSLDQLKGASGFNHLREDINDRVKIRSEGKAQQLIINSLVIE